ncbi:MAG TPA: type I DNA topoisomerase [Dehalococcoidia bacterium]|nr:type I DNA topoisomerase [Dehalococcoidia bacterium]
MTSNSDNTSNGADGGALVIVESPAKARTIAQYLGPEFIVESSVGHIRDLPSSASEIPAKYKKESWARVGIDVDHNFEPLYVVPPSKKETVSTLKKALKKVSTVYLATDEDREGEAIAWHLVEVLKPKIPIRRMVFHEITKAAVEEALQNPREIDAELVEAQEARRILDRLYGYEVSPVLWRKVKPRLSAGRVQSAALSLIVDRERARMRFVSGSYWDVDATLRSGDAEQSSVRTRLAELGGKRVATGRDFDTTTGELKADADVELIGQSDAEALAVHLKPSNFTVSEVAERPYTQPPPAPFVTSTLQQEAGRKLRFTAQRTMQAAQSLYENGYITYMRTDSTNLSEQAVSAARSQITSLYGPDYVPEKVRTYATKSRGAQEAHEAIRPAGESFRTPEGLARELDGDRARVYELIWQRTVASQMKDANGLRTNIRFEVDAGERGTAVFTTSGKVITFPGFLRAYVEGSDDPDAERGDQERLLPPLSQGQQLPVESTEARGHQTQPPSRFTEASLVRDLEERGIGRPSTYASIIQTIIDREYAQKQASALVPTFMAFAVIQLLEQHFAELVNPEFTARMERDLDDIAEGELDSKPWLRNFYFGGKEDSENVGLHGRIAAGWEAIDARAVSSIPLGADENGEIVFARVGRYGPYVQAGDEGERGSVPDGIAPDELTLERALQLLAEAAQGDKVVGAHPQGGRDIKLKTGRFGAYVQMGEDDEPKETLKRASLWPTMTMESLTLDQAVQILSYPKSLGTDPKTGSEVMALDGPNGPYLRSGDETRSLRDHEHLGAIELTEALAVLAEPRQRGRRGAAEIASLGVHPDNGEPVKLLRGRFGPYVTDGTVNASIPKGRDPVSITLDDAVDLIAAREVKLRDQGKHPRAPKPKRKPRAKAKARKKKSA